MYKNWQVIFKFQLFLFLRQPTLGILYLKVLHTITIKLQRNSESISVPPQKQLNYAKTKSNSIMLRPNKSLASAINLATYQCFQYILSQRYGILYFNNNKQKTQETNENNNNKKKHSDFINYIRWNYICIQWNYMWQLNLMKHLPLLIMYSNTCISTTERVEPCHFRLDFF